MDSAIQLLNNWGLVTKLDCQSFPRFSYTQNTNRETEAGMRQLNLRLRLYLKVLE